MRHLGVATEEELLWSWAFWARPQQLPPSGAWRVWFIMAGRGFGKTRSGAEAARAAAKRYRFLSFLAPTADSVRVVMIEGESGVLAICPKHERPRYQPSKRQLIWPNGSKTLLFSAEEPDRLRGPQHQWAWVEEPASFRYPEAMDQLLLGLRLPPDPRVVVTGTPKPVRIVRELLADDGTVVSAGTSYENAQNLDPAWYDDLIGRYEGTRLGRQELLAQLLTDVPGAGWSHDVITHGPPPERGDLRRVSVGVDPSASDSEEAAEMGIVIAGEGWDGRGYVLADRTTRGTANERSLAVLRAAWSLDADVIVAETNNGGDWIPAMLRATYDALRASDPHGTPQLPHIKVVTASRGKLTRAEPLAALYEQGLYTHTPVDQPRMGWKGPIAPLANLEDQMTTYVQGEGTSPDRLDALVWASTELRVKGRARQRPTRDQAKKDAAAASGRPITAGMRDRQW